ncbi:MAG: OmpA/MotB domain protein, partial [Alphaproteobacteria bacterium]|nr:OmpA/MotB domain protein [Alphaproteobacteria bacterium]
IIGHTDSSGSTNYNEKLSVKRANAVRDGLIARGLSAEMVRVESRGESDLLVKTADNVREPANRRAQITLE